MSNIYASAERVTVLMRYLEFSRKSSEPKITELKHLQI